MPRQRSRRHVLTGLGALTVGGLASTAGCLSNASPSTSEPAATADTTETRTDQPTEGQQTVTDATGRSVSVPATVERVVALGSSGLRFVTYAGGVEKVVGVEQLETSNADRPFRPYTLANQQLTELPTVGTRKSPDLERILQTDPDVVIYGYASQTEATTMQEQLGVPVVSVRPGGLTPALRESFFGSLELLGTILGTTETVSKLRRYVDGVISDLEERASQVETKPRSYVGYLGRGKHGLTFTQPGYVPFSFGGVSNVAAGASGTDSGGNGSGGGGGGGGSGDGSGGGGGNGGGNGGRKGATRIGIDPETLIKWDPSVLFVDLGTESYDALDAPEYQDITAVADDAVFGVLPTRDYGTNFGTVLADAYAVGAAANPDVYDIDPVQKAGEIYDAFVGADVYQGVTDAYGNGFGQMS